MDMLALLQCLHPAVTKTTLRQFSRVAQAMLVMTGRVTMLGLSRWAGTGGSYRTVQRFFSTVIPWATLFWVFFRHHVHRSEDGYLVSADLLSQGMFRWPLRWDNVEHTISRHPTQRSLP